MVKTPKQKLPSKRKRQVREEEEEDAFSELYTDTDDEEGENLAYWGTEPSRSKKNTDADEWIPPAKRKAWGRWQVLDQDPRQTLLHRIAQSQGAPVDNGPPPTPDSLISGQTSTSRTDPLHQGSETRPLRRSDRRKHKTIYLEDDPENEREWQENEAGTEEAAKTEDVDNIGDYDEEGESTEEGNIKDIGGFCPDDHSTAMRISRHVIEMSEEAHRKVVRAFKASENQRKREKERAANEISTLKAERAAATTEIEQLKADVVATKTKIEQLKADVVTAGTKIGQLKADLVASNTEIEQLKADVVAANSKIQHLKADVHLAHEDHNAEQQRFQTEKRAMTQTQRALEAEVEKAANRHMVLETEQEWRTTMRSIDPALWSESTAICVAEMRQRAIDVLNWATDVNRENQYLRDKIHDLGVEIDIPNTTTLKPDVNDLTNPTPTLFSPAAENLANGNGQSRSPIAPQ